MMIVLKFVLLFVLTFLLMFLLMFVLQCWPSLRSPSRIARRGQGAGGAGLKAMVRRSQRRGCHQLSPPVWSVSPKSGLTNCHSRQTALWSSSPAQQWRLSMPTVSLRRYPLDFTLAFALVTASGLVSAQQEIPLWPSGTPGGFQHARGETVEDRRETGRLDRYVGFVSKPTLTFYPAANPATAANPNTGAKPGPIVLVLPGGGFRYLAIDKEGEEVARWLNTQGIAAAVLKYRTADPDAERSWSLYSPLLAEGDAGRAIRVLRRRAAEWHIDPQRIGMLGFSAGGTMAIQHTIDADAGKPDSADPVDRLSSLPNSVALVYSTLPDQKMPKILPAVPFFIVHGAADKKAPVAVATKLFQTIIGKGGKAELHVFQDADHGFGVAPAAGTVRAWPTLYVDWLRASAAP
jgi:acetyl esterase/lipase